jgi:hypothetical protein|tara:strand:+ start:657 stop:1004 length:348 start_codon:yes stop_codon:yes gene_type:complete
MGGTTDMTTETIDWNLNNSDNKEAVALKEVPLGEEVSIKFDKVFQSPSGTIGAEVTTDIAGEIIWLRGAYGPQNGMMSLVKAADNNPESIEGNTFTFTRIESENSPVGYAYRWTN